MNEKRLPLIIFVLPIAALLLTIAIFSYLHNIQQKKILDYDLNHMKNAYEKHAVEMELSKIDSTFGILEYNYKHIENELRPKIKEKVEIAHAIMTNIYNNNKNMPKKKIESIIKGALEPVRFDKGKGYFFIYDLDGNNILLPPDKSAEGKNFLNFKDITGNYPVREAVKVVKTVGEGFFNWYWYKPNKNFYSIYNSEMHKKIGYVKYFKLLNWFVGTGVYIDDEKELIKERFVKLYAMLKRLNREYFLSMELLKNGRVKILSNALNPTLDGKYTDKSYLENNEAPFFKKIFNDIRNGKVNGIINCFKFLKCKKTGRFIYYRFYSSMNLLVVTQFDLRYLENIMKKAKNEYKKKFDEYAEEVLVISVVIIFVVGSLFLIISTGVNTIFFNYQKDVIKKEKKLEKLASYDKLTGIYNRNKFDEILNYELNMSKRYNHKLSLVMLDLDHFKRINDKYGHTIGDVVLKKIADTVKSSIRATDTFARWGGEEFFIILPKTGINEAVKIAENLRVKIENTLFEPQEKITCSFGVVEFMKNESKDYLIKRADNAMYIAKEKGRNRVEVL